MSNASMTPQEARAAVKERIHVWVQTTKGRIAIYAHTAVSRAEGKPAVFAVGYEWYRPGSHYASGRVYDCVMGRGDSWNAALAAAEKRHAANVARNERRDA